MNLPDNHEMFNQQVIEKIRLCCDSGIWPIDYEKFTGWLSNFNEEQEIYLAFQILDSLIVRSKEMALSSLERLFNNELRSFLIHKNFINHQTISQWKKCLRNGALNSTICFAPVTMQEHGESGHVIYRMLEKIVRTDLYTLPDSFTQDQFKAVIFLDDFTGSGDQFIDFYKRNNFKEKLGSTKVIFSPLIAYEVGIENIKKAFPEIEVLPTEYLLQKDGLFSIPTNEPFRKDPINSKQDAKSLLEKMKSKYAPGLSNWLGRDGVALPLAFEWGCPNQTISILYMEYSTKIENWNQLFKRRA